MGINIELAGLDGLLNKVGRMSAELDGAVRRGVQKGGKVIQAECKAECPVDTTELRRSIIEQTTGGGGRYTSETGPTAPHGVYVEFGTGKYAVGGGGRQTPWHYQDKDGNWHTTSGQPPQPYMEPGFEASKDDAAKVLISEVKQALK